MPASSTIASRSRRDYIRRSNGPSPDGSRRSPVVLMWLRVSERPRDAIGIDEPGDDLPLDCVLSGAVPSRVMDDIPPTGMMVMPEAARGRLARSCRPRTAPFVMGHLALRSRLIPTAQRGRSSILFRKSIRHRKLYRHRRLRYKPNRGATGALSQPVPVAGGSLLKRPRLTFGP